jgi:hypothetical protein
VGETTRRVEGFLTRGFVAGLFPRINSLRISLGSRRGREAEDAHHPKFAPSVTCYQQLATAPTPQFCKLNRFRSTYGLLSAVFLRSDSVKKTLFEAKNLLFPQGAIAQQPVAQLPWSHVIRLLQMVKDSTVRDFYIHHHSPQRACAWEL